MYKVPTTNPGQDPSPERIKALIDEAKSTFLKNGGPPPIPLPSSADDEGLTEAKQPSSALTSDQEYYYYDDDESELDAQTVDAMDDDEEDYYDYTDYNDIVTQNTIRRRQDDGGHTTVKSTEMLTPEPDFQTTSGPSRRSFSSVDVEEPNYDEWDYDQGIVSLLFSLFGTLTCILNLTFPYTLRRHFKLPFHYYKMPI